MSNAFVCIMGIGTVFVGLICLILICTVMGYICKRIPEKKQAAPVPQAAPEQNSQSIPHEVVAGVCAAIAEDLGTEVKNIKVVSFKKA